MLFILCILTLILLYIIKSYKIFDFDWKSISILTFVVVDFNYFVSYHKFVDNVKFHKTRVYDVLTFSKGIIYLGSVMLNKLLNFFYEKSSI